MVAIREKGPRPTGLIFLAALALIPGVVRAAAITNLNTIPGGFVVLGSGTRLVDTGSLSGGVNPTGTITFTLFSPSSIVVDTETALVNGNGTYTVPVGFFPTVAGTYQWQAIYSGDGNNLSSSSQFGTEPEAATAAIPIINTIPGGSVLLGDGNRLIDTATLSGGFNPTGTITFVLLSPSSTVVDTETVLVNGNGTYTVPVGFVPNQAGNYQWQVIYSGDANNVSANSQLGTEPEFASQAIPTLGTNAGGSVFLGSASRLTDTANLSGGFNPTGTIVFQLFDPTSNVVDTEIDTVSGNGIYNVPSGFLPSVAGTYQWQAIYAGDSNNLSASSQLGTEPESVLATPEPSSLILISIAAGMLGFRRCWRSLCGGGSS